MVVNLNNIGGWRCVNMHTYRHAKTNVVLSWCYWLHAIVSGVSLILFILCYFPPDMNQLQTSRRSRIDQLKRIDYGGFILYAGGLICLLLALCKFFNVHDQESRLTSIQHGVGSNINGTAEGLLHC